MEKIVLTEKEIEIMQSVCTYSAEKGAEKDFTPDVFKDLREEIRPVFKVRLFTVDQFDKVPSTESALRQASAEDISEIARKQVFGWKSSAFTKQGEGFLEFVPDENGNPDKKVWQLIPRPIKGNIYLHVLQNSGLLGGEKLGLVLSLR